MCSSRGRAPHRLADVGGRIGPGRDLRVGAALEQQAHRRGVAGPCRAQERRGAGAQHGVVPAVHFRPVRLLFLEPRVRVGAVVEERRDEIHPAHLVLDDLGGRAVRCRHGVHVDGGVERGAAVLSAMFGSALRSSSAPATSKWPLMMAETMGLMPS